MSLHHSPRIVTDGLVLYLDAANPKSYPGTGTSWYDLSGNGNNGTLVNGIGYDSNNRGSMVFDGVDDFISINYTNSIETMSIWFNRNSLAANSGAPVLIGRRSTACFTQAIYTQILVQEQIAYFLDGTVLDQKVILFLLV